MMKRILLIGISGTYNYGCEAIVRGTVNILRNYNPSLEIFYASYNYEDDLRRLAGCDVQLLKRDRTGIKWLILRILKKVMGILEYPLNISYDSISWIVRKKIDTIFSIGGDIYTLPPGKFTRNPLACLCEKCVRKGIKYIVWGASVGPFDKNILAGNFYKNHLQTADLLVVREQNTAAYLKRMGFENKTVLSPDPSFFVKPEKTGPNRPNSKPEKIGINLSPLSVAYDYKNTEQAIKSQARAIEELLEKTEYQICLVPHVFSKNPNDNDLAYLKKLQEHFQGRFNGRIEVVGTDCGFLGMRNYIRNFSFMLAARMHCALNAVAAGVPAVFLAYSDKARGMARFVYDTEEAALPISEFQLPGRLFVLLQNWNHISHLNDILDFNFTQILMRIDGITKN